MNEKSLEDITNELALRVEKLALEPRKRVVELKREMLVCKDGKRRPLVRRHTPKEFEERFLAFIRTDGENGCWRWTGSKNTTRYGEIRDAENRHWLAHRFMYHVFVGPVQNGLCVLHRCDNPECTKPSHLFLGTMKDNSEDAVRKGRMKSHKRKLSSAQVVEMRKLRQSGVGVLNLANQFNVSQPTVSTICNGHLYQEI